MQKYLTSILLVAGTCIGGGTIALPMELAKLGLLPSIIIMLATWFIAYYTSLVSVELNLQADKGLHLGEMGNRYSGKMAGMIGNTSVKLLCYALLAAYIYGGASVIQKLLEVYTNYQASNLAIKTCLALGLVGLLLGPLKIISSINNLVFIVFAVIFILLIGSTMTLTDLHCIPWLRDSSASNVSSVISIVFTSFGYQVIFHTLRNYCGRDAKKLRRIFYYGSLLAAVVYIFWTSCSLGAIFKANPEIFSQIAVGTIDVGEFVEHLAVISRMPYFQVMVWWMSILAILTSMLGVGIGLAESIEIKIQPKKLITAIATVVPAYLLAAVIPNAFIKTLGYAGAILVFIAMWMPTYLFLKANFQKVYLTSLNKWPLLICCLVGIWIVILEVLKI